MPNHKTDFYVWRYNFENTKSSSVILPNLITPDVKDLFLETLSSALIFFCYFGPKGFIGRYFSKDYWIYRSYHWCFL